MRITSKGQVTIPREIRERFGLWPQTEVEFVAQGDTVYLRKASEGESRGDRLVAHLRGKASVGMTTDQILALTRGERQ
jgi:AbrB family looped-hinge helix DNA binding protein